MPSPCLLSARAKANSLQRGTCTRGPCWCSRRRGIDWPTCTLRRRRTVAWGGKKKPPSAHSYGPAKQLGSLHCKSCPEASMSDTHARLSKRQAAAKADRQWQYEHHRKMVSSAVPMRCTGTCRATCPFASMPLDFPRGVAEGFCFALHLLLLSGAFCFSLSC